MHRMREAGDVPALTPEESALTSFVALLKANNPALETAQDACPDLPGWVVGVGLNRPKHAVPREGAAQVLAVAPTPDCTMRHDQSMPSIRLDLHWIGYKVCLSVVTSVPARPEFNARWIPVLAPMKHQVLLVAMDKARTAILRPGGDMHIVRGVPIGASALPHAETMFFHMWRISVPLGLLIKKTGPSPSELGVQ